MPHPENPEESKRFARQVKADKLRLLYEQSLPAVVLTIFVALLLSAILWQHAERDALIGWLTIVMIASTARVVLFVSYHRAAPEGDAFLAWEKPYFITLLVSSLVWGLGCVWIMPKDSLLYQAITYYFLMGMAGGAIAVYSATRLFTIMTILIILLPITLWMLLQGESTPMLMALAAFLLIIAAVRSSKVMASAMHQTFLLTHELKASKEAAERLARTDALTGLNNRRAFNELAEAAIRLSIRQGSVVSAIILDLDHFKKINDTWGHSVGDLALQHAARVLQNSVRRSDICARHGGEEFAVLLPDTDLPEAAQVAEKIRAAMEARPVRTPDGQFPITASCGVASGGGKLDTLVGQADAAMYRAKEAGRNRVVSAQPEPHAGQQSG